jgi:hypothetical protein
MLEAIKTFWSKVRGERGRPHDYRSRSKGSVLEMHKMQSCFLDTEQRGNSMTAPNAFDWKEYTDEERARRGDPFQEINRKALHSQSVSKSMNKLRDKKPMSRHCAWY